MQVAAEVRGCGEHRSRSGVEARAPIGDRGRCRRRPGRGAKVAEEGRDLGEKVTAASELAHDVGVADVVGGVDAVAADGVAVRAQQPTPSKDGSARCRPRRISCPPMTWPTPPRTPGSPYGRGRGRRTTTGTSRSTPRLCGSSTQFSSSGMSLTDIEERVTGPGWQPVGVTCRRAGQVGLCAGRWPVFR